jgi:hypothetical protein
MWLQGGFRWVCGSARLSARAYPVLLIGLIGIHIRFPEKAIRRHGSIPIKIHTGHKIDYIAENSTEIRDSKNCVKPRQVSQRRSGRLGGDSNPRPPPCQGKPGLLILIDFL